MSIPPDRKKKLKKLAKVMDSQSKRPVPPLPPIIEMLDMSLSPMDLDYLLDMGTRLHTYDEASARAMMSKDQFKGFFNSLLRRGFVEIEYDDAGGRLYRLGALAVGWYETQMHYRMGKEREQAFSENFQDVFSYMRKLNFFPLRQLQNALAQKLLVPNQSTGIVERRAPGGKGKTIEVNQAIDVVSPEVYPAKTVSDLIREHGKTGEIGLFRCVCRHGCGLVSDPCRFDMPDESCIVLGKYSRFWLEKGYGRRIPASEALDVIEAVREKGAVHTVMYEKDDTALPEMAICNCCWDCCGVFRAYNMGAGAFKFKCHFSASAVSGAECKGCGKCEKFCPTGAVIVKEKRSRIREELCIGCGQCVDKCPNGYLELISNERVVFLPFQPKSECRLSPV